MSLFSNLMGLIFKHAPTTAATVTTTPAPVTVTPAAAAAAAAPAASGAAPAPAAAPSQPVDVGAILDGLAAKSSEQLDWKHSIVDLMKLVGMDSSLSARKQLAAELHYTGDTNDSATMNVWLHKSVMQKLAENGGKIPAGLI